MSSSERWRKQLGAAVAGAGLEAADQLCRACVDLLEVDGAAISLVHQGQSRGTFGSSGDLSRRLDAYQFTFGEGPCLDAAHTSAPVLVPDVADPREVRWPAFAAVLLDAGVHAVFALPITVAASNVGALDLFRRAPGPLTDEHFAASALAAELACLPLLDLIGQADARARAGVEEGSLEDPWEEVASLERVEVYQATGMLIVQLGVGPTEALVRLRARAFTTGQTASEAARDVVDRRVYALPDGTWHERGATGGSGRDAGDDSGRGR